jgi:pimeloyl-ACP methyl ester carboxylesterase
MKTNIAATGFGFPRLLFSRELNPRIMRLNWITTALLKTCLHVIACSLAIVATANAQQVSSYQTFSPTSPTPANTTITIPPILPAGAVSTTTTQNWAFEGTIPNIAMIPIDDDLTIPIPIGISEYTLSDPAKGFLAFKNGRVDYAIPIPIDKLTRTATSLRPVLFVSISGFKPGEINIPGLRHNAIDVDPWQGGDGTNLTNNLSFQLSGLLKDTQYKHFSVAWQSAQAIGSQGRVLADYIKSFLAQRSYPWDIVLVGYSRGGAFAHEVARRLQGQTNVSNLHVWLLDATAATTFGDFNTNPSAIPNPSGTVYGYMKRDNRSIDLGTFELTSIDGYNNYGLSTTTSPFIANLVPGGTAANSHVNYPNVWLSASTTNPDGFAAAFEAFRVRKNNVRSGGFPIEVDSGTEVVKVGSSDLAAALTASCAGGTCSLQGTLGLGSIGTLTFDNLVSSRGIDFAVSSTAGAASVIFRGQYVAAKNTTIFSEDSIRVDRRNGINSSFTSGAVSVNAQLNFTNLNITANIGGTNLTLLNLDPIGAVVRSGSSSRDIAKAILCPFC